MSKAKKIIPIAIIIICLCIGAGYILKNHSDGLKMTKIPSGMGLLDFYEKNNDLVGWINIPGETISYPVMSSDDYLHMSFDKEYSERGTPFVMSDWTEGSRNTMIYGHNMWVEKTIFNPLHKFEEKDYWENHKTAEFYVIRDKESSPYVEKRTYAIHAVDLVSVNDELYSNAEEFNKGINAVKDLFDEANINSMYDTGIKWQGGDCLTLCTCSYHIKGNRDAGRILVFGTRIETEKKDIQ